MTRRWASKPIAWSSLSLAVAFGCVAEPSRSGLEKGPATASILPPEEQRPAGQHDDHNRVSFVLTQSDSSAAPPPAAEELPAGGELPQDAMQRNGKQPRETIPLPPVQSPAAVGESQAAATSLTLEQVVASVEFNYPLLAAAIQEQGISSGQLLAAQGAFDINLRGREFWQLGTFDSQRFTVGVDQNTAWNGVSLFAGYRQSTGDFPIYYGDRKTGDGGEFRAGVLIPLLAGRAIDRRRAIAQQAAITRALADPNIATQRLDFIRAASRAYWTWVATGRRFRVAQEVLEIAEDRDRQLAELVQRGAVAEIERLDNRRVIVERQARLIAAERAQQQASIALSLYFRGDGGAPQIPSKTRLPKEIADPQPIDRTRVRQDIELAFQQRPELQRLRLQRERTTVELEQARNQMMPNLNLGLEGYQDVGAGTNFSKTPLVTGTQLDRTAYIASLQLDVPLQQREPKGRVLAAQSALTQLSFQDRFQRDRIVAEIQDATSALERAFEALGKARENVAVARKVELGERERFERGQGTIVILNLRELVAAEASFAEVDALAEYYRSLADYRAAVGMDSTLENAALPSAVTTDNNMRQE